MASAKNNDKLQEEVVNSLQSIISSCGGQCQADELFKDYRELVGSSVPVKQLKHGTFASFLLSLPNVFDCTNRNGILFVKLKDSSNATHIAKLAKEQRKNTRKIKGRLTKPARRPAFSPWIPNNNSYRGFNQNWRQPYVYQAPPVGFSGPRHKYPTRQIYKPLSGRLQTPPRRPENTPDIFRAVSAISNKPAPQSKQQTNINKPNAAAATNKCKSPPPNVSKNLTQGFLQSKAPLITERPPLLPTPTGPLLPTPSIPKINPSNLYYNDGNFSFPRAIPQNQDKQYAPYFEVPPRFKKTETPSKPVPKTYKQTLEEEIKRRGLQEDLVFRSIPCGKKTQKWLSVVIVNQVSVSSYPGEYDFAHEAEEEAARLALEMLKNQEETSYPVTKNLKISIERVEKILRDQGSTEVLWLELVQKLYKENFHEILPDNWVKEVDKFNKANDIKFGVIVDNPVLEKWTVQLKQENQEEFMAHQYFSDQPEDSAIYDSFKQQFVDNQAFPELATNYEFPGVTTNQNVSDFQGYQYQETNNNFNMESLNMVTNGVTGMSIGQDKDDAPRLPTIQYPAGEIWDICVTCVEGLGRICFRLIDDQYVNDLNDMVTEMELYYMEDKNLSPVAEPKVGHIYVADHEDSWSRVRVVSVSGDEVLLHFLDHGDQETIPLSKLHVLHDKFMTLPAQGLSGILAGLEFGGSHQNALNHLQNLAVGQALLAQIVSRENPISLVLYDTSTDEDVNINEKVAELVVRDCVNPTLPAVGGVAEVYLIHTTSTGDVYVQIETETYKVLQNLLEMASSRTKEILGEDAKIDLTRIYLARFSEDGEWYRAVPRGNVDPNGKVLMWFVDFGNSDHVPTTSISLLEVNDHLANVPHQALLCRLHNVPHSESFQWTTRTSQRLVDLIPEDSPLLLKVHKNDGNGGPPLVELFKRLHPKNELVSINATLSMDESLFCTSGDSNNNSVRKEVILSPSRVRNRIGSSNSITSGSSGINSGPSSMNSQPESSSRASSPLEVSKRFQQPGSLSSMDLPAIGEYFDVVITYAASPSHFAVQPWKMGNKVGALMDKMKQYYSVESNLVAKPDIKVGEYYAVKHNDQQWYRVYLTAIFEGFVSGLFVDYGDCCVVTPDSVQPLHPVFRSLPCQSIKAKLAGVAAANMDWKPEDSFRFKELVEYKELVSIIKNIERDPETNEFVLSLRLVDTSDPKSDVYIDDLLFKEQRAIRV